MGNIRIAYCGAPEMSSRFLEKLLIDKTIPIEIAAVITPADKPVGRHQEITPCHVKQVALKDAIPTYDVLTSEVLVEKAIDLVLVYAYGKIIPSDVLKTPKYGFWNIHPSMLPHYRGPAPVVFTLLMGDDSAGCSLMLMDEQMDHGPVIAQDEIPVSEDDTNHSLLEKLTYVGYYLFRENIHKLSDGQLDLTALPVQNDSAATYSSLLKKEDGYIPVSLIQKALNQDKLTTQELPDIMRTYLSQTSIRQFPIPYAPYILYNMFRGMTPWPGLWTYVPVDGEEKRLKLTRVGLKDDKLDIREVQLEGKNAVPFEQFNAVYKIF